MKRILLAFLLAHVAFLTCPAQDDLLEAKRAVRSDGYAFWVYTPQDYRQYERTTPLILFLHGASLRGNDLDRVLRYGPLDAVRKGLQIPAIIVAPQNPKGHWDPRKLYDILEYTRSLIPREFPIHALGIGHPENVARCFDLGYEIFDCAMPTRDARHGRLYSFDPNCADFSGKWLKYIYISDDKHIRNAHPVMADCDCPVCRRYSIGYLRHLFKMNDSLFPRLATIHNVRVLTRLCEILREKKYGRRA